MRAARNIALLIGVVCFAACSTTPKVPATSTIQAPVGATTNQPPSPQKREQFKLSAEAFWRIELPQGQRFDASALVWDDARLLIVADAIPTVFEVEFGETNVARLKPTTILSAAQLEPNLGKRRRYDLEGLARDNRGRLYFCEEGSHSVCSVNPVTSAVEKLEIDWNPVRQFFSADSNASFEGVAVGDGKLWVANERERPRVIEIDLEKRRVIGDYAPAPLSWGLVTHYSDICWFKGRLFLLLRHHRVILEIDPDTRDVVAEHNYMEMEEAPEHRYMRQYPTGTMEGLTVDDEYFWLVTDNNGFGRAQASDDRRPTLFKCKRPSR